MNINVKEVNTFEINEETEERLDVSLSVEEREAGLPAFCYATIEWSQEDNVVDTFSIASAEILYNALGEAIEAAKQAVSNFIETSSQEDE